MVAVVNVFAQGPPQLCSKSGDVLTCSAEHCALDPGDEIVLRIEAIGSPGPARQNLRIP
jgi:hypothetical protein